MRKENHTNAVFKNSEEMMKRANLYFAKYPHPDNFDDEAEVEKCLKAIQSGRMPTINGLALFMGFSSINSLYDYKEKKGFSKVLEQIRTKIASYYELSITSKFGQNAFNWLKSVQSDIWQDKQQQSQQMPIIANIVFIDKDGKQTQQKTIEAEVLQPCEPLPLPSKSKELTHATKPKQISKPKSKAKARAKAKK
jgi:hypothetical protein